MRRHQLTFLLVAAVLPGVSCAASFDCTKVSTVQEKMICADGTLSGLDDDLATLYRSVLKDATAKKAAEIQAEQKEWLRRDRNGCKTRECLAEVYRERISQLSRCQANNAPKDPVCPVSERALTGLWENVSGGVFEQMEFGYAGSERVFNSWLHERPAILGGTWKVEDCTIFIRHPTEMKLSYVFRVLREAEGRIHLRDVSDGSESMYMRMKP